MKIVLHGIKNDYSRDGFDITVVKASDMMICPVDAMKVYADRTAQINDDPRRPVFTPVNFPYSGLSASAIAKILSQAIRTRRAGKSRLQS